MTQTETTGELWCSKCAHTFSYHEQKGTCAMRDCGCDGYAGPIPESPDEPVVEERPVTFLTIEGVLGFFWTYEDLNERTTDIVVYGGRMQRAGGIKVGSRTAVPEKFKVVTDKYQLRRAIAVKRAVDDVLESAPKPSRGRKVR